MLLFVYEPVTGKAREVHMTLKFTDGNETEIEGLLAPYGGPFSGGKDVQGEFFSPRTDFVLSWFPSDRPLLFNHGLDAKAGPSVVGRIKALSPDEAGLWMKAQLDAHSEYYGLLRELVKQGKLALSSGSMRHLVKVEKSGEIRRWPLVEGSLTPTPANPFAEVDFAGAQSHFKAIGLDLPDLDALKAQLDADTDAQPEPSSDAPDDGGKAITDALALAFADAQAAAKALETISLETLAGYTDTLAVTLLERTKDLQERRVKEGRVLSTMNRKRLVECVASMRTAVDDLAALLDSTDPAKAEAKAQELRRLRVQLEAMRLRTLID